MLEGAHFTQWSRAWYAFTDDPERFNSSPRPAHFVDEIVLTATDPLKVLDWEFTIRWYDLSTVRQPMVAPRLEMFADAWQAITDERAIELFEWLNEHAGMNPSPDSVVEFLVSAGWRDVTPTENPITRRNQ